MKYIDADKLNVEIDRLYNGEAPKHDRQCNFVDGYFTGIDTISQLIDSFQEEQPEEYFYCKYGGTRPKCSDCKRNHLNSPYATSDINTWFAPSALGTKQCSDYIPIDQPEVDLEKEIEFYFDGWTDSPDYSQALNAEGECVSTDEIIEIARHFFNLGLNTRKGE